MAFSIVTSLSGVTRIAIEGRLEGPTLYSLRPELAGVAKHQPFQVEMELSRLRMVDAVGIQVLLSFFTTLHEQGCRLTLKGLHAQPPASFEAALNDVILGGPRVLNWSH